MARNPIEIPIASETGAFEKGVKSGILEPLEDAERALKDLNDAGPDKLDQQMRDAAKQTGKLKDETRDAADAIDRDFKRAYRDAKQSADDGLDGMSRRTEEVSGELKQNLGETFSSFRGDLEDLPQIAQDVFGGMAGSVGTLAGSLGLAAGAAGIGLLVAGFQQIEERRQELEDRANNLASAYIEAGTNVMDAIAIASRTSEIITGDERDKAKEYAELLGTDLPTAARAMAGDVNALAAVNEIANRATEDAIKLGDQYNDTGKTLTSTQQSKLTEDLKAVAAARELNGVVDEANSKFNDQQGVLKGLIRDADGAAVSVDELGNTVYKLPDGAEIMIDAKTGQATADVSRFRGDTDGVIDHLNARQVRMRVALDDSAVRNYRPPTLTIPGQVVARGTVAMY